MEQLTFGSIFAVGSRPLTDLQQQNSTRANLLTLAVGYAPQHPTSDFRAAHPRCHLHALEVDLIVDTRSAAQNFISSQLQITFETTVLSVTTLVVPSPKPIPDKHTSPHITTAPHTGI